MSKGIAARAAVPFNISGFRGIRASFGNRYGAKVSFSRDRGRESNGEIPENIFEKKSSRSFEIIFDIIVRAVAKSGNSTVDKLAKAAMSKEMLAAGLAAAAAAISASPAARRKIRDAGLDAADTASQAASNVMSSATKLGSIIAEAVADAAQRVMSGKWASEDVPAAQRGAHARRDAQAG